MKGNYDKLVNKLNKTIKEERFRNNLLKLITKFVDKQNCSWYLYKKYAIFTGFIDNCSCDLKITFENNTVQYVYFSINGKDNEVGTYKKTKKQAFTNVCKYTIEDYVKQSNLTKKYTISVFDNNMIEQFKYVANDYQSYYIKDGKKCFTPNDCLAFNNMLNIRKQIRTREDNIIDIIEKRYYNDNMKQYDEISYGIAPNINNDPYVQLTSTGKLDNHYIPYGGEYNNISHETYLKYMHGEIDDKELFKNYKSYVKRLPLV